MQEDGRPNPQDLLEAVEKLENRKGRGKLRVFLGMCPGVGKTYAMLKAGKEQLTRGVDVAIGVVETHGRAETQELVSGLRIIPKSSIKEMDLDNILIQRPSLVLVDELAHTNTEGSRHQKRYQDVEEILDKGIDVYTTLNIQHIESRNDQVAQITSVRVRETVPDAFLERADQIEVIDLSPRQLLQRMEEGKVYLGDGAQRAAENFFKEEHLTALRELALRFTAEKVDQDLAYQMTIKGIEGPWNTNERLLVALSHSPFSARLIRTTRRMAYNLEAPWIALYVNTGEILSDEDQKMLQKNISLARELGAEVVTLADSGLVHGIQKISQEKNVTQIVIGRPKRNFIRDLLRGGAFLDQLVAQTNKIDIHVIRADRGTIYRQTKIKLYRYGAGWQGYYNTAWFLAALTLVSYILLPYVGYRALGSIFLLAILFVAAFTSTGPTLFAAVAAGLAWDYLFIPPQFTFVIHAHEDIMMLGSFFVTAVVGSYMTNKIRRQETILTIREEFARNLYELGRSLANSKDAREILDILKVTIDRQFKGKTFPLLLNKKGELEARDPEPSQVPEPIAPKDLAVAEWSLANRKAAGWSTQTLSGSQCVCFPMMGNSAAVGVLLFYPDKSTKVLSIEQEIFFETVLAQVAIALERLHFGEVAQNAKLYEASEKLHQTLLNSVSHELRTPITTIIGTATALKDKNILENEPSREALTDELVRSAMRLDSVVENLLDMSRIEKGALQLKKEWFEAYELVREAVNDVKHESQGREIKISGDLGLLIEGDFKLLKHAISNLLQNALRYSPPTTDVEILLKSSDKTAEIIVKDQGAGIPIGEEKNIFEKFYRLAGTPTGGLGLGLSIVKNTAELHGGSISVRGSMFELKIPVRTPPLKLKEITK